MEYRVNRKTGDRVSIIGLGTAHICAGMSRPDVEKRAVDAMCFAYEHGVNFVDLATGRSLTFPCCAAAFSSVRKDIHYQIHFGAYYDPSNFETASYGWSTNLDTVKRSVDWQLSQLKTDYIDYGMIHCLDEEKDWRAYRDGGILDFLLDMKKQGVVRHIGLSSHTPALASQVLDTGLVELLMFSINPSYDYHHGELANGTAGERMELYRRCEAEGVGITVMKPFFGGQLLDAKVSPFGQALTRYQCIQYALDKPGVLTVLPGIHSKGDMAELLGFLNSSPGERDYSVLGTFTPRDAAGACVYCNHCQPCPAGLNVGLINKYYDLALAGDALAVDHYAKLEKKASGCTGCGHCDRRCPFHVAQSGRMREISVYFDGT